MGGELVASCTLPTSASRRGWRVLAAAAAAAGFSGLLAPADLAFFCFLGAGTLASDSEPPPMAVGADAAACAARRLRSFLLSFAAAASDSDAPAEGTSTEVALAAAAAAFAAAALASALASAFLCFFWMILRAFLLRPFADGSAASLGAADTPDAAAASAASAFRCCFSALRAAFSALAVAFLSLGAPAASVMLDGSAEGVAASAAEPSAADAAAPAAATSARRRCFLSFFLKLLPALGAVSESAPGAAAALPSAGSPDGDASAEAAALRFLSFLDFELTLLSAMLLEPVPTEAAHRCPCTLAACDVHRCSKHGSIPNMQNLLLQVAHTTWQSVRVTAEELTCEDGVNKQGVSCFCLTAATVKGYDR